MGVIYIMWNFPFFWKCKIGITRTGKAAQRRKSISTTTPGITFPVFLMVVPFFVEKLEGDLHRVFKRFHSPFSHGSGHTEWFFLPVIIPAVIIITVTAIVYWSPFILLGWFIWQNR